MLDKKDFSGRFNSYLKHISSDGQTIRNLFDVFEDMLAEIKELKEELYMYQQNNRDELHKIREEFEKKVEEQAEKRYKQIRGEVKTAVYRSIKKYLDEEFRNIDEEEDAR